MDTMRKNKLDLIYQISLYILNNNPYGKNKPMELGLFSRILFESEASQLFGSGLVRIKDFWKIDKENDLIFPVSFEEILISPDYKLSVEDGKIKTDQEANLDYISECSKKFLDSQLTVPTTGNWTIDTWYRTKMNPCYRESVVFAKNPDKITPMMILDYVYTNLQSYVGEHYMIDLSFGAYN